MGGEYTMYVHQVRTKDILGIIFIFVVVLCALTAVPSLRGTQRNSMEPNKHPSGA